MNGTIEARDDWFPIRVVSQRTGVNTVTLRAWERRYGLLRPMRTAKGHRLYSAEDIARVQRIVEWLGRGVAISQVAPLLAHAETPGTPVVAGAAGDGWTAMRLSLQQAASGFDETRFEESLGEAFGLYPFPLVVDRLLLPLLTAAPDSEVPGDVAAAGFLRACLRRKLAARFLAGMRHLPGAPVLLAPLDMAAAGGLGLPLLAAACQSLELPVVALDEPLPPTELLVCAARRAPRAILLYGESAHDVHDLQRQLSRIVAGSGGAPVLLAGASARIHDPLARGCRVEPLPGDAPTAVARRLAALPPEVRA